MTAPSYVGETAVGVCGEGHISSVSTRSLRDDASPTFCKRCDRLVSWSALFESDAPVTPV